MTNNRAIPPILIDKHYDNASLFSPESLLHGCAQQRRLPPVPIPEVCLLDPDGDITRMLRETGRAERHPGWACFHTEMVVFSEQGRTYGMVGCAVGAPFAVLVAEQLFASGCQLVISISSSGRLDSRVAVADFLLITRALRDEGTSYHYLPPGEFSTAPAGLVRQLDGAFGGLEASVQSGATWTTDAPFRETGRAIEAMRGRELLAVEMEAAALYAFAEAYQRPLLCFTQLSNELGGSRPEFDKGAANGAIAALQVIGRTVDVLLPQPWALVSSG